MKEQTKQFGKPNGDMKKKGAGCMKEQTAYRSVKDLLENRQVFHMQKLNKCSEVFGML